MKRKPVTGKRRKKTSDPRSHDAPAVKVVNVPTIQEKQASANRQNNACAPGLNESPSVPPVIDWVERRTAPTVNLIDPTKMDGVEYKHPSPAMGQLEVMQALGTASPEFFDSIIAQLKRVSWRSGLISEAAMNFLLGVITHFRPTNHVEVMLAAQIATVHLAAMRFAPELMTAQTPEQIDLFERAVTRLFRTSAMLVDSYSRRQTAERNDQTAAGSRKHTHSPQANGRADRDSAGNPQQASFGNGAHADVKTEKENRGGGKSNELRASQNSHMSAQMPARPRSH